MSIGAVVVTYQTPAKLLARCRRSLKENGITDQQVVNNSTNNLGFAAAANLGAKQLSNEFILFLNPDAELTPHSLSLPVQYFSAHPKVAILGPLMYGPDSVCEAGCYGQPINLWSLFSRHLVTTRPPVNTQAVGWISGGAMLVRRSVFRQLSGFDPNFFLYWEDVDLCRRVWHSGYAVHLLPAWRVFHRRGASLSDLALKTRLYDKSADNYFRKHYSKPIWLLQHYLRLLYRLLSPVVH